MKRQYRVQEGVPFKYIIKLYNDGKFISHNHVWLDELEDRINELECRGYTQCYTEEEVEEAKHAYLHMLENVLVEPDEEIGSE